MEAISTGEPLHPGLGGRAETLLVGAFAHPEIWVYLWGPLELRRGLQQPLRRTLLDNFNPGHGTEITPSLPLSTIPLTSGAPVGRPQPPPALLKDFPLAVGRQAPHPAHLAECQLASLEPVLHGLLFLDSPPTVEVGG